MRYCPDQVGLGTLLIEVRRPSSSHKATLHRLHPGLSLSEESWQSGNNWKADTLGGSFLSALDYVAVPLAAGVQPPTALTLTQEKCYSWGQTPGKTRAPLHTDILGYLRGWVRGPLRKWECFRSAFVKVAREPEGLRWNLDHPLPPKMF